MEEMEKALLCSCSGKPCDELEYTLDQRCGRCLDLTALKVWNVDFYHIP